ncbi:sigma-54 interaction domain-containing protein [Brevibacillus migulae]|uniref:sigma-54 interaction domain-containing protein n=1 Tax=Brevibacillus migulae TaxID=1644114 RepID=UPI00106E04B1|nr:sigma 54-interacting transcriptional regulator [Brevibacillus migulae]
MEKPSILLVTKSKKVGQTFARNLRTYFGSQIDIYPFLENDPIKEDLLNLVGLVLVSQEDLLEGLPRRKESIPILVARRNIEMIKLVPLMDLNAGTTCLFVQNDWITAVESIEFLQRLGFAHLEFVPYAPGMKLSEAQMRSIDVAITHGWPELVPPTIEQVINLDNRPIDLTTIFDIAQHFRLSVDKAHFYTADFFRDFVQLGRNLSISVNNEKQLKKKLESILNAVHEGIIGIDDENRITFFNEDAGKILRVDPAECVGKTLQEAVPEFASHDVLYSHGEVTNHLLQTRHQFLLVTKIPMMLEDKWLGEVVTFQDVTKVQQLEQEIRRKSVQLGLTAKYDFHHIIGASDAILSSKKVACKLANSDYTVLITGENGTGKEVFAQAIHQNSSRRDMPFVPVNFAGLTESLAESELFGYEEGAFTGAKKGGKVGLFELAHNGTIFLDEIGDAPLSIQAALLRVLQERQVMRVGGNRVIPVNVRVIAATNRNLREMVQKGTFREDLYYRLEVLPLHVPALRERRGDILLLIDHFLELKHRKLILSDEVKDILLHYSWPGNIRELENVAHYLTVIVEGNQVELRHLPERLRNGSIGDSQTEENREMEQLMMLLHRHGTQEEYADILEKLWICSKREERIGRGTLNAMLTRPLTEAQIRTRLDALKRHGFISVGLKKQGMQITALGIEVLRRLKQEQA